MSCVVKTATPFIDKEILCLALKQIGCKITVQGDRIITDIPDRVIGHQTFERDANGKYYLSAYSYTDRNRADFVSEIGKHYEVLYQKKLEEIEKARQEAIAEAERQRLELERIRMEEERKAFVEKQKNSIIEKAKAKGYSVKETMTNNKIKLVLVRHTY